MFIFPITYYKSTSQIIQEPNPKEFFSVRKLSTYSGSCLRVRRSSDNAEQDIGFVGDYIDTASLLSFVGSNSGFATKWYGQKGYFNFIQPNTASQPRLVNSGTLDTTVGGHACINFNVASRLMYADAAAANIFNFTGGASIILRYQLSNIATSVPTAQFNQTNDALFQNIFTSSSNIQIRMYDYINNAFIQFATNDTPLATGAPKILGNYYDGSNLNTGFAIYTNNTQNSGVSSTSGAFSQVRSSGFNTLVSIGAQRYNSPANGIVGMINEIMYYESDNRSNHNNTYNYINDYYV